MRAFLISGLWLAVALVFNGCVGLKEYQTPCEFDVRVRLESDTNKAHQTCRNVIHSCPDSGCQFKDVQIAAGCADTTNGNMVVVDQDYVMAHEMRHFFDAKCLGKNRRE